MPAVSMMVISGSAHIGVIDGDAAAALGAQPMFICLPEGVSGPKGYGLLHVADNERRMKMIKGLGFGTAEDFIIDIAKNWTAIHQGDNGRYILIREKDGYGLRAIIQHEVHKGVACWSVVTAIPGRKTGDEPILYQKG